MGLISDFLSDDKKNRLFILMSDFDELIDELCSLNINDINKFFNIIDRELYNDFLDKFKEYLSKLSNKEKYNILTNDKYFNIFNRDFIFELFYDIDFDKNYLYKVFCYYFNKTSDDKFLSYFENWDIEYFINSIDSIFGYIVNKDVIRKYINIDKYNLLELFRINNRLNGIFSDDIINELGNDLVDFLVLGRGKINSFVDMNRIIYYKKMYYYLTKEVSFELFKFSIELVNSNFDSIKRMIDSNNFSDIDYFIRAFKKKLRIIDLNKYKKQETDNFIDYIKSCNDKKELVLLVKDYLCIKNGIIDKCDISLLNCINTRFSNVIKYLYSNNNLDELKDFCIYLTKNKNIVLEGVMFSNLIKNRIVNEINDNTFKTNKNVTLRGESFNMLVHCMNAFGHGGSIKDFNKENGMSKQICLSSITDINLGVASRDSLILGFSNLDNNSLLGMSNRDMCSMYDGMYFNDEVTYYSTLRKNSFMTCNYNEYSFKRNDKLKPSYVVCFNGIRDIDYNVSSELNIPIVLIDKNAYRDRNYKLLCSLWNKIENGNYKMIKYYFLMFINYSSNFKNMSSFYDDVTKECDRLIYFMNKNNIDDKVLYDFLYNFISYFDRSEWSNLMSRIEYTKML